MASGYKKTHREYCKEVKAIHGNNIRVVQKYIIDGAKITHMCSAKHKWKVRPNHVLRGIGCPYCANINRGLKRRKSKEAYNTEVAKIHKGLIIPIDNYEGAFIKIRHRCNVCEHVWYAAPDNVINTSKTGCPLCVKHRTYSSKAIRWLKEEARKRKIRIRHAGNWGEYSIPNTRYKVDGFHKPSNTIFEFYGDVFHGNPKKFKPRQKCHPFINLTAGRLYRDTLKREKFLKELGYNVVTIWESDYDNRNC